MINVTTRSGTNTLHGAAWEYLRNTDLNAVGFFKPNGGVKPIFIQNQFGAAAGGPIRKDKMFIFGDYEGLRRITRTLNFSRYRRPTRKGASSGRPSEIPIQAKFTPMVFCLPRRSRLLPKL